MSRPVRIEYPGATYHITSKGTERGNGQAVFQDREDRSAFLNTLDNVVSRFGWLIHSYVLMDNYYHLVVEIREQNLSKGMRQLNGVYTQHFNRRHGQEGPIFQGRFKSVLFEKSSYLLPVCRDVVLNPVRERSPSHLNRYRWSSYRALAGLARKPSFLHDAEVLDSFGKRDQERQQKYRKYVQDGFELESPLLDRSNQVLLGSPKFLRAMQPVLQGEKLAKRGPKQAKRRRSLQALFKNVDQKSRAERNELICKAHVDYSYTLMDIGEHLGLHYTTVSKIVNAAARRA